ncbi:MAG TPA: class I SAM-dependent methyltransferase [Polyangiaceae bacterium]|nr:class I SAM-dependent methyltransferase [Polyangiaceae bacterium]
MAFDGLLRAWSDERTAYRDAERCIVDKPAGVACDAGSVAELGSPTPLGVRLAEHGLGQWRVASPMPARASGATWLVRGEAATAVAATTDAASHPPIDAWTYVIASDDWRLPPSGSIAVCERRAPRASDATPLEYRVERRQGPRALVRLQGPHPPEVVLAALRQRRQPVVGDSEASGAPRATRLLLHVAELRGGSVRGEAPLPAEFDSWLLGRATLPPERFGAALANAGIHRHGLAPELGAFRLLGEEAGELAGVSVERYGEHAVLSISSEEAERLEREMVDCLMDHGAAGVYVKRRVRADLRRVDAASLAPPLPVRGAAAPEWLELSQGPVRCSVNLGDGLATGLFLDQRANWDRVRGWARDAAWLNLFCYTGAFTLAAAAGGAAATTSVDLAGRALSRLAENLELNGWAGPQHRLLKSDVPTWLGRAQRAGRRFDGVVLDPPSFGTRARGVLSTRRDNTGLVDAALGLLAPRGRLICVSHHRKISQDELGQQVFEACARAKLSARVDALVGGWDCPTLPGVTATKSVLAQLT